MTNWSNLAITLPFQHDSFEFPDFWKRIDENIAMGRPTIIPIDGKSQTGKSTVARLICRTYASIYHRFFTVDSLINYLSECGSKCKFTFNSNHRPIKVFVPPELYKQWFLFDEIQLEAPDEKRYTDRNLVLLAITSGFGFLKPNLIMTMPDLTGISRKVYKNITFRMSTTAHLGPHREIVRDAWIKTAIYDDNKNRYFWRTVEKYRIPVIKETEDDRIYDSEKAHNFFHVQLEKWKSQMKMDDNMSEEKANELRKHWEDKEKEREAKEFHGYDK